MMLRLTTLLAMVVALICRVECHVPRVAPVTAPSVAAAVAAASKVARPAVGVQAIKLVSSPPYKRTPVSIVGLDTLEPFARIAASARAVAGKAVSFPQVLAVRRRIPRLGSEEPPWRPSRA